MNIPYSDRLIYEPMTSKDAKLMHQLDQDPEVMKYINGGQISSWDHITNVMIPRMESYTDAEKGWGLWKISTKNNQQFIGWILVRPMNFFSDEPQFDDIELGWRLLKSSWGKGYATEAALAIKTFVINKGYANKLTAIAIEENHSSTNIMKKLGMKFIKKAIHEDPLGDQEVVFYQLTLN